jgi:hypothetical protein
MAKTVGPSELENGPIEEFTGAIQCDPPDNGFDLRWLVVS